MESGTYELSWVGTATATINGTPVSNGGSIALTGGSNATVRFSSGTFSLPQLEKGTTATPFEYRPIGTELALCQRYYEKSYALGTAPGTAFSTELNGVYKNVVGYGSTGQEVPQDRILLQHL